MTRKYGWIPDKPDQRDHIYTMTMPEALPPHVDLRSTCPPVYDQQDLGSCTANAIAGAIEFDQIKETLPESTPSRLFIYYNERVKEHTVNSDAGAAIRDGVKSVNKQGACAEIEWPYDITQFTVRPPEQCYEDAFSHRTLSYKRLNNQSLSQLKGCLASGYVFVFGFSVYESFESQAVADSGIVPMPQPDESMIGGHAVVAVGYDDAEQVFIVRNSWGAEWGDAGYCYMPYVYLSSSNLASDFWTIRTVK